MLSCVMYRITDSMTSKKRTSKEIAYNLELLTTYLDNPYSTRGHRAASQLIEAHQKEINYVLSTRSIFDPDKRAHYTNIIIDYWFEKLPNFDITKKRALHYYLLAGANYAALREFRNDTLWRKKKAILRDHQINQINEASELDPILEIEEDNYLSKSGSKWYALYTRLVERDLLKEGSKLESFLLSMVENPDPSVYWDSIPNFNSKHFGSIKSQLTRIRQRDSNIFDDLCLNLNP